jgi:hypothetical protein
MKLYNPEKTDRYIEVPIAIEEIKILVAEKYFVANPLEKDN